MTEMKGYLKKILTLTHEIEKMTLEYDLSRENILDSVLDALAMEHPVPGQGMTEIHAGFYRTQFYKDASRRITIPSAAPEVYAYTVFITQNGVLRYVPIDRPKTLSPIIEVN